MKDFFESTERIDSNELIGKKTERKRGRGSKKQSKVLVMSTTTGAKPTKKNQKSSKSKFVKIVVV